MLPSMQCARARAHVLVSSLNLSSGLASPAALSLALTARSRARRRAICRGLLQEGLNVCYTYVCKSSVKQIDLHIHSFIKYNVGAKYRRFRDFNVVL